MAREISDGGLVEAGSSVDVDGVGDVFRWFRVVNSRMEGFVLTSRRKKQTTVGSESQSSEKRRKGLIEVDWSIADPKAADAVQARGMGHNSR